MSELSEISKSSHGEWSHHTLMWRRAPVQWSCKSNQTNPTNVRDPGRANTAEPCIAHISHCALCLICNQDPASVTQRHGVTRDCRYFKTPVCVNGLGMVPKEQRKNFPLVLSSPQIWSPISNVTAILPPVLAPGEVDIILQQGAKVHMVRHCLATVIWERIFEMTHGP